MRIDGVDAIHRHGVADILETPQAQILERECAPTRAAIAPLLIRIAPSCAEATRLAEDSAKCQFGWGRGPTDPSSQRGTDSSNPFPSSGESRQRAGFIGRRHGQHEPAVLGRGVGRCVAERACPHDRSGVVISNDLPPMAADSSSSTTGVRSMSV